MYLLKLYRQSKFWFIVVVLFAVIQLTLNIRRDASLSPFFHYGMYSEVIEPEKIYVVPEVVVNNKPLRTKDFSPQQWDEIIQPVVLYDAQKEWNSKIYHQHIKPLLHFDSSKYINNISDMGFYRWYESYLQTVIHKEIDSVKINFNITAYSDHQLKKTGEKQQAE
jgi:hypothetical protein